MPIPHSSTTAAFNETSIDLAETPQGQGTLPPNPPLDQVEPSRLHSLIYTNWDKYSFWASSSILFTKTALSITSLLISYKQPCDQPLKEFMCIFGIMSAVSFVSNIFHYKYKKQVEVANASTYTHQSGNHNAVNTNSQTIAYDNSQNTSQNDTRKLIGYFEHLKGCLDAFSLLWLFFGCAWVFSCKTCQTTAPFLYYSSVSWILYGYVMICIPLLFFSVVVCVVPTAFLIVKHIRQQRLQREAKKILKTIPLMTYSVVYEERYGLRSESDNGSSSTIDSSIDCCSICLGGFKWKEKVRRLDCKHYFHQNCGDKWLVAHATCPLCLQSINAV